MPDEPGLTTAAVCGILTAGAAFVEVYKLGIHYSPLILPVHFRLAKGRRRSRSKKKWGSNCKSLTFDPRVDHAERARTTT